MREFVADGANSDLRADVRLDAVLLCHRVKSRYTIEAVPISKCDGRHIELNRSFN
jgi:hypothetical protein